jgi:hypothetical protein
LIASRVALPSSCDQFDLQMVERIDMGGAIVSFPPAPEQIQADTGQAPTPPTIGTQAGAV